MQNHQGTPGQAKPIGTGKLTVVEQLSVITDRLKMTLKEQHPCLTDEEAETLALVALNTVLNSMVGNDEADVSDLQPPVV